MNPYKIENNTSLTKYSFLLGISKNETSTKTPFAYNDDSVCKMFIRSSDQRKTPFTATVIVFSAHIEGIRILPSRLCS